MGNKQLTNNQILIRECVAQEYEESASYENEAAYFEYFSASQVLKDYDLSDDEIESGIVGAGNDGGCDGMYIFLNKNIVLPDQIETITASKESKVEVIIIQAKRENSFGENAIMKWKTTVDNLLQLSNSLEEFRERYGTVADILRKGNIIPTDIKEMDLGNVTEERIGRIRDQIYDAYKQQGGNSHVAKSALFIVTVNKILGL
ncbi:MAG: hypothetical protein HFH35_09580 [Eubacterium sp.]|nr:hypothetical protein [Eubacterium sp.]